jgi:putative hydrolase of the HAD superfamily
VVDTCGPEPGIGNRLYIFVPEQSFGYAKFACAAVNTSHTVKQALILDLDNTIYPVSSVVGYLFERFFELLDQNSDGINYDCIQNAKDAMTRMPFHLVADKFNFSVALKNKGIELLKNLTYDLPMQPFDEYNQIKSLPIKKFLVTTGFTNLQRSKIKMLAIKNDFAEVHIVDPETSQQTKKNVFADIMARHVYKPEDLLVIGDDPESEIKAANWLGIETFLFDPENKNSDAISTYKGEKLTDILTVISDSI